MLMAMLWAGRVSLVSWALIAAQASGPVAPATDADLHNVRANFCNLIDAKGRVIFTPFAISLSRAERDDWWQRQRDAGSTHTVLSPTISYPGSPISGRDYYAEPDLFAAYVSEALNTRSANGRAFTPILILDHGGAGLRDRIDRFWPGIRASLGDDAARVIVVPGWELIAGQATSAELSYAIGQLHALGFPHIWMHFSPDRASGASRPLEADDPWRGDLPSFWTTGTGLHVEGLLWQSHAVKPDDDRCDPASDACWLKSWAEVVSRVGKGSHGWRAVHLAYFEGPAFHFYRGQSDAAFARRIALKAKAVCDKLGVACGFGNGVPR